MELREKISEYIQRSSLRTNRAVAEEGGLDNSTLNKMMNGQRKVSIEYLNKICETLNLPLEERDELFELYERERVGDDVFNQRCKVRELVEKTAMLNADEVLNKKDTDMPATPLPQYTAEPVRLNGANTVTAALLNLLRMEFYGTDKLEVLMVVPSSYKELSNVLYGLTCVDHTKISIKHIVRLASRFADGALRNLSTLCNLVPYIVSERNSYRLYYYYDSHSERSDVAYPFPFYLIANDKLFLLSADLNEAMYVPMPTIVEAYRSNFERSVSRSTELTTIFDSSFGMIGELNETDMGTATTDRYYFVSSPMTCLAIPAEKIMALRRVEFPETEIIAGILMERYKKLHDEHIVDTYHQVFSLESVDRFVETGFTDEYPTSLINAYPLEMRLELLQGYVKLIKEDIKAREDNGEKRYSKCVAANPERFNIPSDCTINCVPNQYVNIFVTNRDWSQHCSLIITEPSVVSAFTEFFNYLPQSKLVLTPEETIEELEIRCRKLKLKLAEKK